MSVIRWKECYETGVQSFDDEHRELVSLINGLYEAIRADRDHVDLGKILDELLAYTEKHFRREESLLEQHDYPDFEEHKRAHEELAFKVREMRCRLGEDEPELPLEVYAFLRDWLLKHVVGTDQKYGEFLKSRGVS